MGKNMTGKDRQVAMVMGQMRLDKFKEACNNITPSVYAAIAIALYEKGWRYERINNLFMRSQDIWTEKCLSINTMMEECYEKTGIDLRHKEE